MPLDFQVFLGGGLLVIGAGVMVWLVANLARGRPPRGGMASLLLAFGYLALGFVLVLQAATGDAYPWLYLPILFVLFLGVFGYIRSQQRD